MGVDVREIVPFAEPVQPCGHAVRVHRLPIVLREYKILILIICVQPQPLPRFPCPILGKAGAYQATAIALASDIPGSAGPV